MISDEAFLGIQQEHKEASLLAILHLLADDSFTKLDFLSNQQQTCLQIFSKNIKILLQTMFLKCKLRQYYPIQLTQLLQQTTMSELAQRNSSQPLEDNLPSDNPQNPQPEQTLSVKSLTTPPLFRHYEKNIVLFAYNKEIDEDPPHQIMIMQQSKKHYNQVTEEEKVLEMFGNFNLQGTTEQLFLTKIDPQEHRQIAKEIQEIMNFADRNSRTERLERRKKMFESSRPTKIDQQLASQEVIAKRKIRVVKMDSLMQGGSIKGMVQLGGKTVEYEDFNIMNGNQDYYALIRRKVRADEVFPQVCIEQKYLNEIDFEPQDIDEEKKEYEDEYDSNDSENSAFDYPDEEQSRSSEEIIRDYDSMGDCDEEPEDNEEQLYLRYLRREKRKQREMEEEFEPNYEEYD